MKAGFLGSVLRGLPEDTEVAVIDYETGDDHKIIMVHIDPDTGRVLLEIDHDAPKGNG